MVAAGSGGGGALRPLHPDGRPAGPVEQVDDLVASRGMLGNAAPKPKLVNEDPKPETVDYDTLIKSWQATAPAESGTAR